MKFIQLSGSNFQEAQIDPAKTLIVAAAGGGDYTTIGGATAAIIAADGDNPSSSWLILVYPGTYTENVTLPANTMLRGMSRDTCIVSGTIINSAYYNADYYISDLTILAGSPATSPTVGTKGILVFDGQRLYMRNCKVSAAPLTVPAGSTFYHLIHGLRVGQNLDIDMTVACAGTYTGFIYAIYNNSFAVMLSNVSVDFTMNVTGSNSANGFTLSSTGHIFQNVAFRWGASTTATKSLFPLNKPAMYSCTLPTQEDSLTATQYTGQNNGASNVFRTPLANRPLIAAIKKGDKWFNETVGKEFIRDANNGKWLGPVQSLSTIPVSGNLASISASADPWFWTPNLSEQLIESLEAAQGLFVYTAHNSSTYWRIEQYILDASNEYRILKTKDSWEGTGTPINNSFPILFPSGGLVAPILEDCGPRYRAVKVGAAASGLAYGPPSVNYREIVFDPVLSWTGANAGATATKCETGHEFIFARNNAWQKVSGWLYPTAALTGEKAWFTTHKTDYTIEADISGDSGSPGGTIYSLPSFCIRARTTQNWLAVDFYNGNLRLFSWPDTATINTTAPQAVVAGTTYHIKIVCNGNNIQIFWNNSGSPAINYTLPNADLQTRFNHPSAIWAALFQNRSVVASANFAKWTNIQMY